MHPRWILLAQLLVSLTFAARADEPAATDPFWTLIHDEAVLADLKATADQRRQIRAVLDPLDVQCFRLRNRPTDEAAKGFGEATAQARKAVGKVFKPQQVQRLEQIAVRSLGPAALVRDDLAKKLNLDSTQRDEIRLAVNAAIEARGKLQNELRGAKTEVAAAQAEWEAISNREREAVNGVLTNEQKQRLAGSIARDFDINKLGRTAFKVPDLAGESADWLNSTPLETEQLRGKVVVVHFFAFGCINCIHNYPTYREWQREFAGRDVQLIGIHTPETKAEHDVEKLKGKLKAEALEFPVLVDNGRLNWNAFGNSMWPSVYVIDKQGYMRAFWAGELRWQGATGDKQMQTRVEALLAES